MVQEMGAIAILSWPPMLFSATSDAVGRHRRVVKAEPARK
jgi:hypothetical protein